MDNSLHIIPAGVKKNIGMTILILGGEILLSWKEILKLQTLFRVCPVNFIILYIKKL